jgi:diaminopimelate decarboxylase
MKNRIVPRLEVFPPASTINDRGHLVIGSCDVVELAAEYGTPLYVFDEQGIRDRCAEFIREFGSRYPETDVLYACKTFTAVAMFKLVAEEGLGIDVVSGGELAWARAAGFPMERVSFAGNNKDPRELEMARDAGIGSLVVDNLHELAMLRDIASVKPMNVLLRLSPGIDPHTHRYNTTGTVDSKFGLPRPQWDEAVATALAAPGINPLGLHFHLGSNLQEYKPYLEALDVVLAYAAEIRHRNGFETHVLSIGGGFGVRYTLEEHPPTIAGFAEALTARLKEKCRELSLNAPRLVIEPGRALVAEYGVGVYTVGSIKEIPGVRTYVSVDGGMGDNIRQPMYGFVQEALLANRADGEDTRKVTVSGKYCESGDILIREINLPDPAPGDILAMAGSGAYAVPMASNYNGNCRPAIVFIKDGRSKVVRRRETLRDMIGRDIW